MKEKDIDHIQIPDGYLGWVIMNYNYETARSRIQERYPITDDCKYDNYEDIINDTDFSKYEEVDNEVTDKDI